MARRALRITFAATLVTAALVPIAPAGAIVGGTPDTVHTNVYVSFDNALRPDPLQAGISAAEKAAREAFYIKGTAHPDPGRDGKLSFSKQHDQGVVVLDAPATTKWPSISPAPLPPVGFMDANQGALKKATFTLVGYGVDIGDKKAQIVNQERRSTTSPLKSVQSEVITFQINANNSTGGGGSCFGDSGGGAFYQQYVLGDASYVNSLSCNATGSYQRDDTPYSRAFLNTWISGS